MHSLKQVENLIKKDFFKVSAHDAIDGLKEMILKHRALVVYDNQEKFVGLLTVYDILERPYDRVIDCMRIKDSLSVNITTSEAIEIMREQREDALAVQEAGDIIGIIYKDELLNYFQKQTSQLKQEILQAEDALKKISWIQSHRVRQPVASILGLIQLIDREPTPEDMVEIITLLRKSIIELDHVINDTVNTADYFEKTRATQGT